MFFKFALLAVGVALTVAEPQHQFPAGVNPSLCPGYPNCDNAVLHGTAPAPPAWGQPAPSWQQPAPSWQQPAPSWQQPAPAWGQPAPAWGAPAAAGGDKFPAGVNPSSCPNYPYCDVNAGGHGAPQVAPLPGWNERLYPAGVASHNCPNYPFCS